MDPDTRRVLGQIPTVIARLLIVGCGIFFMVTLWEDLLYVVGALAFFAGAAWALQALQGR